MDLLINRIKVNFQDVLILFNLADKYTIWLVLNQADIHEKKGQYYLYFFGRRLKLAGEYVHYKMYCCVFVGEGIIYV